MAMLPIAMAVGSALINRQATKSANKQTRLATARQMAFQEDMSNTSYQRGMEDMRKAGLNPILAGKMGGASTPTGASYVAQKATPVEAGVAGVNAYMQNKNLAQNIDVNKHRLDFANSTGIPIENANDVIKSAYSAKHIATNLLKPKPKPNKHYNNAKYKTPNKSKKGKVKKSYLTNMINNTFDGSTFLRGKQYNLGDLFK